jgi:uncharacterized protein
MRLSVLLLSLLSCAAPRNELRAEPLVLGDTFTLESKVLGEARRINVYRPPAWGEPEGAARPVLYVLDGGLKEDFVHVAGLVQVLVGNGSMRPFLVVGIENTQRRRDLTGPSSVAEDQAIAPVIGGAARFRSFLGTELKAEIARRYPTTSESALVGESLAGLFTVETFFVEPTLFDTFIAIEPTLGWNRQALLEAAPARLANFPAGKRTLWFAGANAEANGPVAKSLATVLEASAPANVHWHHEPMPEEQHSTIFHPAALRAFRTLFVPPPAP